MQRYRYFQIDVAAGGVIVRITEPQLYGHVVGEVLKAELSQLISTTHPKRLLIDFQHVKVMSSSVIEALISVKKQLDQLGRQLKLCAMPVSIREIYRTMQLEGSIFEICDSLGEALPNECETDAGILT